ncbi:hypothetical protein RRF57_009579 [Xylaria bambusicola]|uniref:Rhodopsin domain-containing protein n=1 Tax=Xylaria bambusicola TaxID=326684 RepID=A0AAN7UJV2_9PEZI
MPLSLGGVQIIALTSIFTPVSIAALGLRLWSRRINNSSLAFSDYTAILALIFTIAEISCSLVGASGLHITEITATNSSLLQTYLKLAIAGGILWAAANTCVKLSILSLYTTLFPNHKVHYVCYGTMATSVAFFIIAFLQSFLLCTPVQFNWDKRIPGGVCNQSIGFLLPGMMNLVIDAFIVVLPMPILFKLHLPLFKKLGIAVMFSLGAVICIISLFRILALLEWNLEDVTFESTRISIFSLAEPTLGVINACLPTIKPALYRLCGKEVRGGSKTYPRNIRRSDLDESRRNQTPTTESQTG